MFFLFIPPETGVRLSVTSTLHFRDTLHFTITTTTTTNDDDAYNKTTTTTTTTRPNATTTTSGANGTRDATASRVPGIFLFSFFFFFLWITNIYLQCVWYASHDDDNRRHAGPRRRKGAQTMPDVASFGPFLQASTITRAQRRLTQVHEGPQQPTTANEGQRRPMKTKRGPNDASGIVWALGTFFIFISSCFNIY